MQLEKEIWSVLLIAVIASMTQALGISLQRKSHLTVSTATIALDDQTNNVLPLYKRPLWVSGFLIYTISNLIGSTCTIGYLPIVILAPVGAIGLVFNAIFAKWILGDAFTRRTVIGTSLIVVGAGLIAGFGTVPEPNHTLQDLIKLYKRPSFIVYFSLIELFTCIGLISTHVMEYISTRPNHWITIRYPDLKMWLGISYGVFGANISSQAMLFAKSGLELLLLTVFHHDNQFIYPLTWVIVFALSFTAILQLYYLNRGVQLCDTIILVPLNFCSFNVSCLFNGLVYYNQWDRLFWWQVICVLIGIVILVFGVLLISLQDQHHGPIRLLEDDFDYDGHNNNSSNDQASNTTTLDLSQQPCLFRKTTSNNTLLLDGQENNNTVWLWTRMKNLYRKPSSTSS